MIPTAVSHFPSAAFYFSTACPFLLEGSQDAVAGSRVFGENDMAGLLAADAVPVLHHVFIDILVADLGLLILDADLVQSLVQAEVAHNSRYNFIVEQLASLLHEEAININDMVAGDHIALLIHAKTSVRVTVKGKTNIQTVVYYKLLQVLYMSRSAVCIDVVAIRLIIHDIGLCAESVKHRLGNGPGSAIGEMRCPI